ncbi:unnamed protein product [Rotaria sordida]|uniref:NAD(P)(+)--arginine ADP-ribosyltransferase n=1 Tax=Rotaria sordida TaxID=392033 RepID=A0A814B9S4_9BILA|nr:unnamed protein product [Rotaria sordida]CAF0923966.1 unnamed protein product [Rotaria sordida]
MMAAANFSDLYVACCKGDIAVVERLLPVTSLKALNHVEPDGNTCLHAASSRGYKNIVRLLLTKGACRRVQDRDGRSPLDAARTGEVARLFARSAEASQQRFSTSPAQQPEWQFANDNAESFSRAFHWGCIKDRGIKKTVKKIQKAHVLDEDRSAATEVVENYFKDALEEKNPLHLLKAYTVESSFYKQLNREMATGSSRKVFEKLRGKWTGYYTGIIAKNPAFDRFRFSGQTYRGMEITRSDYAQYEIGTALSNKSFQSTSKSWKIAKGFACPSHPRPERLPVVIIFTIADRRSALSIEEISEFQNEEEVLILPGTLFIVASINQDQVPYEIELEQLPWKDEF